MTNCRYIPRGTESNLYGVMAPPHPFDDPGRTTFFISISARIAQVYTQTCTGMAESRLEHRHTGGITPAGVVSELA